LEGLLVKKVQEAAIDVARKRRRRARREQAATDAGLVLQGDDAHPLAADRPAESAMASLLEQVVVPAFAGLARADVDLWVAAKFDGHGWQAAGRILGLERPAVRQARQRILRFLSTEGRVRRLTGWMDDVP
jgi:DNA-directed RNA polymerase specialized sigma24 family protein